MIIGFIGFGKVSKNLAGLISSDEIRFVSSSDGRSKQTADNIMESGIDVLDSFEDVARVSDILISATSPKNAIDAARKYGKFCRGIYLDLNNISPDTTLKIDGHVDNLVDGAIIGKIDSDNPILYVSGKKAADLEFLNEFIETKVISDKIGDVAILKLLRSTYTKTLSAVLIESENLAERYGLKEEFFDILSLTEGSQFTAKSLSRIHNTLKNPKRKSEELAEIIDYFDGDLIMVRAALKKLSQ